MRRLLDCSGSLCSAEAVAAPSRSVHLPQTLLHIKRAREALRSGCVRCVDSYESRASDTVAVFTEYLGIAIAPWSDTTSSSRDHAGVLDHQELLRVCIRMPRSLYCPAVGASVCNCCSYTRHPWRSNAAKSGSGHMTRCARHNVPCLCLDKVADRSCSVRASP